MSKSIQYLKVCTGKGKMIGDILNFRQKPLSKSGRIVVKTGKSIRFGDIKWGAWERKSK